LVTLTEFLLARIAEDEDVARLVESPVTRGLATINVGGDSGRRPVAVSIGPARVLAECEAKRRIVDTYVKLVSNPEHQRITSKGSVDYSDSGLVIDHLFEDVLQPLAQVYADHPDYQQEWMV
jgi:hypothetical protein